MNGKDSAPRPFSVSQQELADRWAQTFGDQPTQSCHHHERTPNYVWGQGRRWKCATCGKVLGAA